MTSTTDRIIILSERFENHWKERTIARVKIDGSAEIEDQYSREVYGNWTPWKIWQEQGAFLTSEEFEKLVDFYISCKKLRG